MEPIRYDGDTAIFTTDQLDMYKEIPTKYSKYLVVEGMPEYETSFTYAKQSFLKKIHRYDRFSRFKKTVYNLLGNSDLKNHISIASPEVIGPIITYVKDDSSTAYVDCKKILKHYKQERFIEYIPALLQLAKKPWAIEYDPKQCSEMIQKVLADFKNIERKFIYHEYRKTQNRKYFINMKYLAIRLLERHGAVNKSVPLFITHDRRVLIENMFQMLIE
jgi:hypothetical protein